MQTRANSKTGNFRNAAAMRHNLALASAPNRLRYAGLQQLSELLGSHGPAEKISLRLIAAVRLQKIQFFLRLYALSDQAQLQAAAHRDDRSHNGGLVRNRGDLMDERLIDF